MATHRIFYIDALKAFAIVLVVMGHLSPYIWETGDSHSLYLPILSAFHMPLFMFLSGFVISPPKDIQTLFKKAIRFILPMIWVGLLFTYIVGKNFQSFLIDHYKNGYWYLYILFFKLFS